MFASIELNESSEISEPENTNPFPDGGPLPPQQSVDSADYDDGWTNTDTPPEEDYAYQEELQAEEAQASYEESLKNEDASSKAQAQLDEHFTTADGRDMTIAQLRGSVVAELAVNEGFIASAVDRTDLWKVSEGRVETTISTSLDF